MAQLGFGPFRLRGLPQGRGDPKPPPEHLSMLLPQGVAALLLPHLKAALPSYSAKDRRLILAAYGVGCIVLSDLLSQNKAIPDWRAASMAALERLAQRSDVEEFLEPGVIEEAAQTAYLLAHGFSETPPYILACKMLDDAIEDLSDRKTSERGSVTLKAAMARLEAMTLSDRSGSKIAA